jgi:hypothetical protein
VCARVCACVCVCVCLHSDLLITTYFSCAILLVCESYLHWVKFLQAVFKPTKKSDWDEDDEEDSDPPATSAPAGHATAGATAWRKGHDHCFICVLDASICSDSFTLLISIMFLPSCISKTKPSAAQSHANF